MNTDAVIPCITLVSNLGSDATLIESAGREASFTSVRAVDSAYGLTTVEISLL